MNKKLLAVAVAGALAAPGLALAQASSVTISGFIKQGVESTAYSGVTSNTRLNDSQMRLVDSASRVVFNSTESLGNGLSGIMQVDVRVWPNTDIASGGPGIGLDGGNTYVGLSSKTMGELTLGRRDLHYMVATIPLDGTPGGAGALQATPTSLIDYIGSESVGVGSQKNTVKWQSPNWNGFSSVIAWSMDVGNSAGDMAASATSARKGNAWNIAPMYVNGPWGIGYSYWRNKYDAPAAGAPIAGSPAGTPDERADTLWGYYKFGDFKIGLGWNKIKLDDATGLGKIVDRDAWTLPMSYTWGPHSVAGHYTVARDVDTAAGNLNDTGARMFAIAYSYSLSKRTQVGLTYAKINNDSGVNYGLFTSNGFGSPASTLVNGESPRMVQATVNHSF